MKPAHLALTNTQHCVPNIIHVCSLMLSSNILTMCAHLSAVYE